MAKKPKEKTIPNWTTFGCHSFDIEIYQNGYDDDDDPIYGGAISFILDDGSDESQEFDVDNLQYISLFTDFSGTDPYQLAWVLLHSFNHELFGNRLNTVWLFDDDGHSEEMDMKKIMEISEFTCEENQVMVH